jgi:hypothetical protein
MLRLTMFVMCLSLLSLSASGCGSSEVVVAAAPTQDELKIAQDEQKQVQEAEMAEQRKSTPTKKK